VDEVPLQRELEEEFGEVKKARLRLRELFFKPSGFNTIYLPVNIERITESLKVY
jgi:8-oxo-dGTP pyrophosphatase MutT (NUDIX family)